MLKAELAGYLKNSILNGRLLPGQRVIEGTWAREAGVAQASVREAINLLITEGFLVKDAGRSARVPRYTQSDIDRIYQIRGALEALAARLAAQARADLAEAEEALDRMSVAADAGDVRPLIDSDLAFHLALARASGNSLLVDMLKRLLEPLFGFVMLRMIETREKTSAWAPDLPRHREILDLIRDGNPTLAAAFVEHSVNRFAASARAVWAPDAPARGRKRI